MALSKNRSWTRCKFSSYTQSTCPSSVNSHTPTPLGHPRSKQLKIRTKQQASPQRRYVNLDDVMLCLLKEILFVIGKRYSEEAELKFTASM